MILILVRKSYASEIFRVLGINSTVKKLFIKYLQLTSSFLYDHYEIG